MSRQAYEEVWAHIFDQKQREILEQRKLAEKPARKPIGRPHGKPMPELADLKARTNKGWKEIKSATGISERHLKEVANEGANISEKHREKLEAYFSAQLHPLKKKVR